MRSHIKVKTICALTLLGCLLFSPAWAATVEYELTIDKQEVNYTGKPIEAMTINGGIPGPVLRFEEGDLARIKVYNKMDVDTSVHWHGLLVPPDMDGVPLISFPPIAPGSSFTYQFPIRQNGTYWYHSHTSLQEQRGVYGAIVIEPRQSELRVDRDHIVLFSDWIDADPHQVLRTLKRGSEWYALEKGSAQSIVGAASIGMLGDYFSRELQRMPAMDIADVAYDRFLANGSPEINLESKPKEQVRLRIIDGSATTFFHLEFAGGPLRIISADGQNVEAINEQRLLIGVAETYDVVVTVPATGSWELRATAHDGSGYASVWLGTGERHPAPTMPVPNLYSGMGGLTLQRIFALTPASSMGMTNADVKAGRFDQPGMMMAHGDHAMGDMIKSAGSMGHNGHDMPGMMMDGDAKSTRDDQDLEDLFDVANSTSAHTEHGEHEAMKTVKHAMSDQYESHTPTPMVERSGKRYGRIFRPLAADISTADNLVVDGMDQERPWPPYKKLRALHSTALPVDAPVRQVRLTLDGNMERYVWHLNNQTLSEADDILIREGEVVRFIMINRTMMHHPMHLHGHFFRVINGQGDYSPLKHTVNVAPMSTTVIEFEANEVGDWFFHCHLLYHMKSGMARAIHYENFSLTPQLAKIRPQLYKDSWYAWGQLEALTNMAEGTVMLANSRNSFSAEVEIGWQEVKGNEWETLLLYNRHLNRFSSVFIGANLGDAIEENRGIIGFHYLLPLNLESSSFIGTDGEARVEIAKEFQLLPRITLDALVQYETDGSWENVTGLTYTLSKSISLRAQWHTDYRWGAGMQFRF